MFKFDASLDLGLKQGRMHTMEMGDCRPSCECYQGQESDGNEGQACLAGFFLLCSISAPIFRAVLHLSIVLQHTMCLWKHFPNIPTS